MVTDSTREAAQLLLYMECDVIRHIKVTIVKVFRHCEIEFPKNYSCHCSHRVGHKIIPEPSPSNKSRLRQRLPSLSYYIQHRNVKTSIS